MCHRLIDLKAQLLLQLVEGSLDLARLATLLINTGNPLLKIHTRLNNAKDLITRAKHALEQLKFLR